MTRLERKRAFRVIAAYERDLVRERLAMCVLALRECGDDHAADELTRMRDAIGRVEMGAEQ